MCSSDLPGWSVQLPPGSRVMETGGLKGRVREIGRPDLYKLISSRLGLPEVQIVAEYGMTELSSQLWTEAVPAGQVPGEFIAPFWLRAYAADPLSGRPLPEGQEGVLRFVDLANVWSVLAIETMDLGVVTGGPGPSRVQLRGRLAGAEARGCSLRMEELWERSR